MAKQKYRVISWILLVAMLLSLYPPAALAAGDDQPEAKIGEQTYATLEEAFSAAQKMTEWNSAPVSRENPVVIELEADVELDATLLVKKGSGYRIEDATYHVRLVGNGHTIRRGTGCTENMIHVAISSTLILENVTLDGSGSTGPYNAAILYIGSTQNLPSWVDEITHDNYVELGEGAVLENNTNPRTGGAVNIEAGTFVLNGGTIRNNSAAQHGGGVYVGTGHQGYKNASNEYYPSKFIMVDGTISGNQVTGSYAYGGGVYVGSSNEPENNESGFVMQGGTIEGNHCAYSGGGIALSGSGIKFKDGADTGRTNLRLLGGTIQNNTEGSTRRPSGVYGMFASNVQLGGAIVISDGLYLTGYTVRKVPYGGKIDVVSDMTGASVALRFGNNSYYPAGQIVVDKAENYTGDLDLSWFDWKWDNSGNLNTTEKLVYNEDESALVVAQKYKVTLQKDPAAGGTVGFADNLADGGDTARTYCEGDAVTIQAIPNEGYRFVQWMDEAESAVSTEAEYTLTVEKAETFTALFEAESYTVALDPNGGTLDPKQDVKSYTHGIETPLPDDKAIARKGYTFAGWYDADEPSGEEVKTIPAEAVGNKSYRAKWLSEDISIEQIELKGITGEQNGFEFCITLPYGSTLPTAGDAFTIQTVHEGATVSQPVQDAEENGKWNFTVTAENGIGQQTYTIIVQIGENPAAENIAQLESLGEKLKESERWEISWADLSAEEQKLKEAFTARLEAELDEFLQMVEESNAVVESVTLAAVTAPVEGTSDNPEGIPGSFTMQIKLAKGEAETYAEKEITILGALTVEPYQPAEKPETPPEEIQGTKGDTEAFIGAATVLAGGAAALLYYYREDLPIWQLSGVVELAAADGTISPAANATVELTSKGEVVRTLTTNTEGVFVARVPKGEYQVTVVWEQDGTIYNVQDTVTAETLLPGDTLQKILLAAPDKK